LEDAVFVKDVVGWSKHCLIPGSRPFRSKRYALQGVAVDDLPAGTTITVVEHHSNGLVCGGGCQVAPDSESSSWNAAVGWMGEAFGLERHIFLEDIAGATITICLDGSFKNEQGAASWIAVFDDKEMGEDLIVPDGSHSSYRSELAGL